MSFGAVLQRDLKARKKAAKALQKNITLCPTIDDIIQSDALDTILGKIKKPKNSDTDTDNVESLVPATSHGNANKQSIR